jgi:hypothetical protein
MATIADIRKQFPQYADISDEQLAKGFHTKYYSDIPYDAFKAQIGFTQEPVTATEQMVGLGSPIARVAKGAIANPLLAINQAGGAVISGAGQLLEKATGPNVVTGFLQDVGKSSSNVVNQYEQATQQARQRIGSEGFDFYELGGALVSPANRFVPGATPVTQAAVASTLNPVVGQNLTPFEIAKAKTEQATIGALFGKTFEQVVPAFKEGARKLLDAGAELQPGQAFAGPAGSIMRTAESLRDTLYKFVGKETDPDKINKAFTYVTVNEALAPVGKSISKASDDGFALVKQGLTLARSAYDEAFNKIKTVGIDDGFLNGLKGIQAEAKSSLEPKEYTKFMRELSNNIGKRFNPATIDTPQITQGGPGSPAYNIDGQGLHNIKKFLQARLENLRNSTEELGATRKDLYDKVMEQFKEYTYRVDPTGAIKAADTTYANIYRVAGASKSAAKNSGNFSPEQLASAAASQSTTLTGGTGSAPLQQYAKQALKIIGKDKSDAIGASDLKNIGVASGLGYTGLLNPTVLAVGGLFGLTTEALGYLAVKNPALYQKFRDEAMKNTGLLSRGLTSEYDPNTGR